MNNEVELQVAFNAFYIYKESDNDQEKTSKLVWPLFINKKTKEASNEKKEMKY